MPKIMQIPNEAANNIVLKRHTVIVSSDEI